MTSCLWLNMNLFELMTSEEKSSLFNQAKLKFIDAGCVLFHYGQKADHFYLVNKGRIRLTRLMSTGEEKVFKEFTHGGVVAEVAMFLPNEEYPMTATADVASQVAVFKKRDLINLIKQSPQLAIKILGFMSQRIAQLMDTLDTLTQVSADQRLVMFFAQQYAIQKPKTLSITMPYAKKVLASQLCVKPETLSRILKKFKDKKLIEEVGNQFRFPDINALCQAVDVMPEIFKQPEAR